MLYSLKYASITDLDFIDCAIHILYTDNKNQCGLPKKCNLNACGYFKNFIKLEASLLHSLMLIL